MTFRLILAGLFAAAGLHAQAPPEPAPPAPSREFVEVRATPREPMAQAFSLQKAAQSLDSTAIAFAQQNRCIQCHANMMYALARPALAGVEPVPPDMRRFLEWIVEERWPQTGGIYDGWEKSKRAFDGHGPTQPVTEPLIVALGLAHLDRTTGKLHPATRRALEEVIARQRPDDGGFNIVRDGSRHFLREHDQALLAAIAIGVAPEDFAATPAAAKALEGIRAYITAHPAPGAYERGMQLWAASIVEGLMTSEKRQSAIAQLIALQREDGGWSLPALLADDEKEKTGLHARGRPSDAYGTGFTLFVLRQAGVPADDARLQRGSAWLKSNQRASGRWFVPALVKGARNLISNSATAWAVLALSACEP